MATNRVWICWEYQRRNKELAEAFGAQYLELNYDSHSRPLRYIYCISQTLQYLVLKRPKVVFAQAPSIVLIAICALAKLLVQFELVIDAHNAAVDTTFLSRAWMRALVRFAFRRARLVIVSNRALFSAVEDFGGIPVELPDKLPMLAQSPLPSRLNSFQRPFFLLVSTFAIDEPIDLILQAATECQKDFTLFISGRKTKAGDLLRYASERIVFTDFLPHEEFDGLLQAADLVIDASTLENCLVCGAYEALEAGVPMLLSDSPASRMTFSRGAIFSANTVADYRAAIEHYFAHAVELKQAVREFKPVFEQDWMEKKSAIEARLAQ